MSYVFDQPVAIQVANNQLSLGLGSSITINCVPPFFGNLTYNLNSTGLNSDIVTNTYTGPINFNVQNENPTNIGTGSYLGTITIGNPNATVQFASTITSVPANDLLINIGQDDINNVLQIGDRVTVLINPNGGTVNIGAGNSTANMAIGNSVGPSTLNLDGIIYYRSTSSIFVNQLSANQFLYANSSKKVIGLGPLTDGQLMIGATGTTPSPSTLTPGSGVTITNAPGSITISATGSGGTVTSISSGFGITLNPNPITTTGTVNLQVPSFVQYTYFGGV